MKKRFWVFAACALWGLTALAGWPFGNIGLQVDGDPAAELDVGGTIMARNRILLKHGTGAGIGVGLADLPGIADERGLTDGVYWYSFQDDDFYGIRPIDDGGGLELMGELQLKDNTFVRMVDSDFHNDGFGPMGEWHIGHQVFSFTNCTSTNVIQKIDIQNCDRCFVQLTGDGDPMGACINLVPPTRAPHPVSLTIHTRQSGNNGEFVFHVRSFQGNHKWFQIDSTDDAIVEMMYMPPFGDEKVGRLVLLRACEVEGAVGLTPSFFGGSGWTVKANGDGL